MMLRGPASGRTELRSDVVPEHHDGPGPSIGIRMMSMLPANVSDGDARDASDAASPDDICMDGDEE